MLFLSNWTFLTKKLVVLYLKYGFFYQPEQKKKKQKKVADGF